MIDSLYYDHANQSIPVQLISKTDDRAIIKKADGKTIVVPSHRVIAWQPARIPHKHGKPRGRQSVFEFAWNKNLELSDRDSKQLLKATKSYCERKGIEPWMNENSSTEYFPHQTIFHCFNELIQSGKIKA